MELIYTGKKRRKDIIDKANSISKQIKNINGSAFLFGDNFIGLSSLLNSGFKDKIDLVYIDPPFNTNQVFLVNDDRVNTISRSKLGYVAYEDIYELETYLEFIRERIILIYELLSEEGSLYFHIDCKIGHYIKLLLDEVFGKSNFINDISRIKSNPKNFSRRAFGNEKDMDLFYAKNHRKNIFNDVRIAMTEEELCKKFTKKDDHGYYNTVPLHAPGESDGPTGQPWRGMKPPAGRHWRTIPAEFDVLDDQGKIEWSKTGNPRIKKYAQDHKGKKIQDIWKYKDPQNPMYPTQKNLSMLDMIVKMSSNPNSIVMDCFAGSGTTLAAAQMNHRRFIGMDKSEVALKAVQERHLSNVEFIKF